MPELGAEVALGRQARAGLEQPELDGRAEALERLLERRLRADRCEDRVRVAADHSRSKPRRRSQSVTAESNAASSTRA